jgi:translocation and assembly module TamA
VRGSRVAAFALTAALALGLGPTVAWADQPKARLQGDLDRTLRTEIQRAIGVVKTRPSTRIDARRRAREAGEAAISVLRSEGYYDYVVEPDVGDGDAPESILRVTPGPRSTLAGADIVWDGPSPDAATADAAKAALALATGAPARAADVLAAEGRAVAAVRNRGYADVAAKPRRVVVDHATHTLAPSFHLAAGELVRMDGLRVVTKGRTHRAWVESLARWKKGAPYDPTKVADLERRLRDAGVFNVVTVSLAPPQEAVDGLRPVIVSLDDRKPHTLELGAGYSTSEGAGLDGKWISYDRFGRADTLTYTARLAQIQQKLDTELDLPDWRRPDQTLKLGGDIFGDRTPGYDDFGVGLRADLERGFGKITSTSRSTDVTIGAAVDLASTREKTAVNANAFPVGQNLKLAIISGLADLALDRSNDPLNPTQGWRMELRTEPTYIFGDRTLPYLKTQAQVTGYLPIGGDARTVLAARIKLGSILGGSIPEVPADRRFFAGGGGSVRGFDYQGVGPKLSDGTPTGGLSLFESSFEVRQKIVGPWGIAAFVDAGSLGQKYVPDFKGVRVGAGLGVRYDLGFGPIRFDVATPLSREPGDPIVQIYVSIGQSF